jgi:hypothetical protein
MLDETSPWVAQVRLNIEDDLSRRLLTLAGVGLSIGLPMLE